MSAPLQTYRLDVAYEGTGLAGWQRQPRARTVQGELERALSEIVGGGARVVGAGRTDAGVHARGQVAHWKTRRQAPLEALVHGVNHHLPPEIRVLGSARMPDRFHAQLSAEWKEYRYRLHLRRVVPPHRRAFSAPLAAGVDLELLEASLRVLEGRHDFAAFAKTGSGHRSSLRTLRRVELARCDDEVECRFVGDGFLRGMVRLMVGTAVDEARGRFAPGATTRALAGGGCVVEIGAAAPARGLSLHRVQYPADLVPLEIFDPG